MSANASSAAVQKISLRTPEHVELPFEVASAGARALAFVIDFAVLTAAIVVLVLVFEIGSAGSHEEGFLKAFVLLATFLARNFYFTFSELRFQGQTFGKRRAGIRVIAKDGGPLSAEMVFARNLTRDIEVFLPLTAIFMPGRLFGDEPGWATLVSSAWLVVVALLPLFNRHRARVGDLVAGTLVVVAPKVTLLPDLVREQRSGKKKRASEFVFTQQQLDVYGIRELQVLEDVLRQDRSQQSSELLSSICDKIKRKIGWNKDAWNVDPEAFLRAFYEAQRGRLEHKMLLGKRQEQKIR